MIKHVEVSPKIGVFVAHNMLSLCWLTAWHNNVECSYRNPSEANGYCRAAVIAQKEYIIAEVLGR